MVQAKRAASTRPWRHAKSTIRERSCCRVRESVAANARVGWLQGICLLHGISKRGAHVWIIDACSFEKLNKQHRARHASATQRDLMSPSDHAHARSADGEEACTF